MEHQWLPIARISVCLSVNMIIPSSFGVLSFEDLIGSVSSLWPHLRLLVGWLIIWSVGLSFCKFESDVPSGSIVRLSSPSPPLNKQCCKISQNILETIFPSQAEDFGVVVGRQTPCPEYSRFCYSADLKNVQMFYVTLNI